MPLDGGTAVNRHRQRAKLGSMHLAGRRALRGSRGGVADEAYAVRRNRNPCMVLESALLMLLLFAPAAGLLQDPFSHHARSKPASSIPMWRMRPTYGRMHQGVLSLRGGEDHATSTVRRGDWSGIIKVVMGIVTRYLNAIMETQESRLRILAAVLQRDTTTFLVPAPLIRLPKTQHAPLVPPSEDVMSPIGKPMTTGGSTTTTTASGPDQRSVEAEMIQQLQVPLSSASKINTTRPDGTIVVASQTGQQAASSEKEGQSQTEPAPRRRPRVLQKFVPDVETGIWAHVHAAPVVVPPERMPGAEYHKETYGIEDPGAREHGTWAEFTDSMALRMRTEGVPDDLPGDGRVLDDFFGEQALEQTLQTCTEMIDAFDAWLGMIRETRAQIARLRSALQDPRTQMDEAEVGREIELLRENMAKLREREEQDREWMGKRDEEHPVNKYKRPSKREI
jgi:hypothetical protein